MDARRDRDRGFTLIELLVVIIIIGILAAIAIPTFLSQREKGYRAAALSDMRNAAVAIENWATDNNGSYAGMDGADETSPVLDEEGFNPTEWVSLTVSADVGSYCILGVNTHVPGKQFVLRSDAGRVTMELLGASTCDGAGAGGGGGGGGGSAGLPGT